MRAIAPASLPWFARHELNLAWRDFITMMTGGRRRRGIGLAIALLIFAGVLHLMANALVGPWVRAGIAPDKSTLVLIAGSGFLFWTVMLSQALESVTRAYYARSDLDLILSSPASSRKLFAVRTGAIALSSVVLACLLASPVIDMLAINGGPQWLAAYGVLAAMGAVSAALAVLVTIGLFRLIGPKRTRLAAQILAGIVGAGFVIGIQVAAIMGFGNMSRLSVLQSQGLVDAAPGPDSALWLPARAAMGDPLAVAIIMLLGFGLLALVIAGTSSGFAMRAIATAGVAHARVSQRASTRPFANGSQKQALRRKEWTLLRRDPWLVSQTLMQVLYLVPPALMLWLNYGQAIGVFIVVVPVVVMASGQLAGGLAWLAISGEDAYDLVVTAPLPPGLVLRAKIEAVVTVIAIVLAPLLLLMLVSSPQAALVTAICAALSAGSATAIQLWFRAQARRSMFRRRQVSSRMATISEAICSITWAGLAAMLVSGSWIAALFGGILFAMIAIATLGVAYAMSPRKAVVLGR